MSRNRCRARRGAWGAGRRRRRFFSRPTGARSGPATRLVQSDLADTLEAIARGGPRAFYEGAIADKLVAAVRAEGGIMTGDDLQDYRPLLRAPVRGRYRGYDIVSMPPSSSGGVVLIEMLNILEGYRHGELGADGVLRAHLLVEAMQRAYADRATYLGDPATVTAPLARLMSKPYARTLRAGIDPAHATPARDIHPAGAPPREGDNTTHFSVVDRFGNAVSNTYTLNFSYGLGLVAEGTGVLLNNELDDFAAKPGAPNAYGLVGGDANAPGPGKRPLSSMTPTIVLKDGKPFLVTGSPGGSRIITAVLQVISNVIDRKLPIAEAVAAPRIHDQWSPDEVVVERGLTPDLDARARSARPQGDGGPAAHLGQFDPGHAAGLCRRRRSAQPRRGRGRVLKLHREPTLRLSCSAKAEHPVVADARFTLKRRRLLGRPPSRTMTPGVVSLTHKIEPPLFAGKHSGGSDSEDTLHRRARIFYPIAALQQRSSYGQRTRRKSS